MRDIRKMEIAWEKVNGSNFRLVEYRDKKGELRPCYQLTKTECLYIATKFNDEARAKLVLRWEELERAHRGQSLCNPLRSSQQGQSPCAQQTHPQPILCKTSAKRLSTYGAQESVASAERPVREGSGQTQGQKSTNVAALQCCSSDGDTQGTLFISPIWI